jgi:hypothetical protein
MCDSDIKTFSLWAYLGVKHTIDPATPWYVACFRNGENIGKFLGSRQYIEDTYKNVGIYKVSGILFVMFLSLTQ